MRRGRILSKKTAAVRKNGGAVNARHFNTLVQCGQRVASFAISMRQ